MFGRWNRPMMGGCGCNQNMHQEALVTEPTVTKCIEKEYFHEVPHVCPVHTHTVNRHIYNHTYTPQYTFSEENQVVNNDPGCCGGYGNNNFQ